MNLSHTNQYTTFTSTDFVYEESPAFEEMSDDAVTRAVAEASEWAATTTDTSLAREFVLRFSGSPYYGQTMHCVCVHCQVCRQTSGVTIPYATLQTMFPTWTVTFTKDAGLVVVCPQCEIGQAHAV